MTEIHKEVYGQGRALVLIHGWAMHGGIWREFARQLARRYQVICLDLPGHGRSQGLEPFTLEGITEALIAAIPVRKFSLLGWSLGATVAIDMANRFPERVESLLILAGNPKFVQAADWPGVKPEVLDEFAAQLSSDARLTLIRFLALQVNGLPDAKRLLQELKKAMLECDSPSADVLRGGLEILKQSDLREILTRLQCPISLILGDRDTLIPLASARALRKAKPAIGLHVIETAGHMPFLSHGGQLLEIVAAEL